MIDREELAQHLHEAGWPGEPAWLHQAPRVHARFLRLADRALALLGQPEPAPAPRPKARQLIVNGEGALLRLVDDGTIWKLCNMPPHWCRCDWPEASE